MPLDASCASRRRVSALFRAEEHSPRQKQPWARQCTRTPTGPGNVTREIRNTGEGGLSSTVPGERQTERPTSSAGACKDGIQSSKKKVVLATTAYPGKTTRRWRPDRPGPARSASASPAEPFTSTIAIRPARCAACSATTAIPALARSTTSAACCKRLRSIWRRSAAIGLKFQLVKHPDGTNHIVRSIDIQKLGLWQREEARRVQRARLPRGSGTRGNTPTTPYGGFHPMLKR